MNIKNFVKEKIPMFITIGGFDIGKPPVDPSNGYGNIDTVIDSKVIVALNYFVGFSAVVAVALIVFAGYQFITAMGDPEKIEKGQKGLTAAIVGMLIVMIARYLVVYLVGLIVG